LFIGRLDATYQRTDLRLSDISNLLGEDWVPLASELGVTTSDVNLVKSEYPSSVAQQAMAMLRLWLQQAGNKATGKLSYLSKLKYICLIIYNKVCVH
jgi:ankyrin